MIGLQIWSQLRLVMARIRFVLTCITCYYCAMVTEIHKRQIRSSLLLRKYGIRENGYQALYDLQGGVCAVCGSAETAHAKGTLRKLAVDHVHATGQIRGLLCNHCNRILGVLDSLNDDSRIMKLLQYRHDDLAHRERDSLAKSFDTKTRYQQIQDQLNEYIPMIYDKCDKLSSTDLVDIMGVTALTARRYLMNLVKYHPNQWRLPLPTERSLQILHGGRPPLYIIPVRLKNA
jgi:hypothetical protein